MFEIEIFVGFSDMIMMRQMREAVSYLCICNMLFDNISFSTARISAAQDLWRRKNTSSTGPDPTVVLQVSEHS